MTERVRIHLVHSDADARTLARELAHLAPLEVGLDFETASNRGYGLMNGTLRLVQLGIEDPQARVEPRQVIVDCFRADPRPLRALLREPATSKLVHNASFERSWAGVHLAAPILSVYDTCSAWKAINRHLASLPRAEAQRLVPGWEPHDVKLGTLVRRYLGIEIPKAGQRSDWSRPWLDDEQLLYAAVDVAVMGELARVTRQIAARLGLTGVLEMRMSEADARASGRAAELVQRADDDRDRVWRALERCATVAELDHVWGLARQMTLTGVSRDQLGSYLQARRATIASAPVLARPAAVEPDRPF